MQVNGSVSPKVASASEQQNVPPQEKKQLVEHVGQEALKNAPKAAGNANSLSDKQIKAIQKLVKNKKGDLTTQKVLSRILKKIKAAGPGYEAEIVAVFKGNQKPQVKGFTLPSAPGKLFYKLGVSYQINVKASGKKVHALSIPKIRREIFTTATNPEEAVLAAQDYKETIIDLALKSSGQKVKGRFDRLSKLQGKDEKRAMKQKSFTFHYARDFEGIPTALSTIGVTKGKKTIDIEVKSDSHSNDYIYCRDLKKQELRRVKKNTSKTLTGKAIFATEYEALLHAPYRLKEKAPYRRLETSNTFEEQISAIKNDIKKKSIEMERIKEKFIQKPYFSFISKPIETVEFKQMIANLQFEKGASIPEKELSPTVRQELTLQKKIAKIGKGQDVSQERAMLFQQLKATREKIMLEKRDFNNAFDAFQTGIQALKNQLKIVQKIKSGAAAKRDDLSATKGARALASHIFDSISGKEIDDLKQKIQTHQQFADKVLPRIV